MLIHKYDGIFIECNNGRLYYYQNPRNSNTWYNQRQRTLYSKIGAYNVSFAFRRVSR